MCDLITLDDILAARTRIAPVIVRTPLVRLTRARLRLAGWPELSETMPDIYLKDESAQPVGSFKLRGAYNRIAQLTQEQLKRGVIAYSSGNHAQGVAYAARALGTKAVIVMPETAPRIKREATAALGADVVLVGPASAERQARAEQLVAEHGYVLVPPFDDNAIIAGQGTCGLEILEQLPNADLILAPISGGGLLSGVAAAVKLTSEAAQRTPPAVWGCEPELAADAHESFTTKRLVEWPAALTTRTLADGLRTQSMGQRNFSHVLQHADGIVTVSEDEIRSALRILLAATSLIAEPSGAVALAAALFHARELPSAAKIAVILSGGNLDPVLRAQLEAESSVARV